jgi:hypothetical protein
MLSTATPPSTTSIIQVITQAIHQPEFRAKLLANPKTVLQEMAISIPASQQVKVLESRAGQIFFVIPLMTDAELQQLQDSQGSIYPQRAVRSRILLRASQDAAFKTHLLAHPKETLIAEGMPIPATAEVIALENTSDQLYIILPHIHPHQHSH